MDDPSGDMAGRELGTGRVLGQRERRPWGWQGNTAGNPTCVSLFSGIGGLDLGLHRAGFRHLAFCESDAYRRDVLRARWPGVPVHDDVRAVGRGGTDGGWRGTKLVFDLLCGGFPCQDLSVAGQRRGLDGNRSGLFFEFARIAELVRPRWLLVENVPGLLSSQGGRDFGTVVGTLADIGYGVAWRILDSRFFGVPQRRRRVFILGALADDDPRAAAERAGQVLAVGTRCPGHPATRGEAGEDLATALTGGAGGRGWSGDNGAGQGDTLVASLSGLGTGGPDDNDGLQGQLVANGLVKRYGKGTDSDATDTMVVAAPLSHGSNPNSNAAGRRREDDENLVATSITLASHPISAEELAQPSTKRNGDPGVVQVGASVRRLTPVECERLQALPDGWTQLGRTPDSKRYAALGDAVTATVAEWIGRRLITA